MPGKGQGPRSGGVPGARPKVCQALLAVATEPLTFDFLQLDKKDGSYAAPLVNY